VAGQSGDDPGVLGNLPRSRPGRRSDKRTSGSSTTRSSSNRAKAASTAQRAKRSTAARKSTTKRPARPAPQAQPPRTTARSSAGQSSDPLTQAVRLAGKVAETGVKTAVGIIRRLPGR
jgi:hypothetical protein